MVFDPKHKILILYSGRLQISQNNSLVATYPSDKL